MQLKLWFKDKFNISLLLIIIIAAYIRLKYLFTDSLWPDEALYGYFSTQLLNNPGFIFNQEFAVTVTYFPTIIITIFDILLDNVVAGKLVSFIFSLLGIVFVYLLGKELDNKLVGLIAAIILSFNHLHWFYSDRLLFDIHLTTMFTITAYFLVKYEKTKSIKNAVYLGLASGLTFFTKLSGILVFAFLAIYFLLAYNLKIISLLKRKDFWILLGISSIFIIYYIIVNLFVFDSPLTTPAESLVTSNRETAIFSVPFKNLIFLITWYTLPFVLLGIIISLIYRRKIDILLLSWFVGFFVLFVIIHPQTVDRYLLPILPLLALSSGIAISELIIIINRLSNVKITKWIGVGLIIILVIPAAIQGKNILDDRSLTYTGLQEAGLWIKENVPEKSTVYVTSVRAIRLFTNRESAYEEGKLYYLGKLSKEDFEKQISEFEKPIYIEIDVWESYRPDWTIPITQDTIEYLLQLGFKPEKIIQADVKTPNGVIKVPVVFIFKLE